MSKSGKDSVSSNSPDVKVQGRAGIIYRSSESYVNSPVGKRQLEALKQVANKTVKSARTA